MKRHPILLTLLLLTACNTKPDADNRTAAGTDVESSTCDKSEDRKASFWYDTTLVSPLSTPKEAKHAYILRDSTTFSDGHGGVYSILAFQDSLAISEGLDSLLFSRLEFRHNNKCIKTEDNGNGFVRFQISQNGLQDQGPCKVVPLSSDYYAILSGNDGRPFADHLLIYIIYKDSVSLIYSQPSINLAFCEDYNSKLYSKYNYDEYFGDSISMLPWSHIDFLKDGIIQFWDDNQLQYIFQIGSAPQSVGHRPIPKPRNVFNSGPFLEAFYHHCYETVFDDKALDSFMDLKIAEKPILEDSIYAIILAYCLRDELDGEFAEAYFYDLYRLFFNRPNEFETIAQKLLLIPEEERERIKSIWKQKLTVYYFEEHSETSDEWNEDSVSSYWQQYRDAIPQSALLWP